MNLASRLLGGAPDAVAVTDDAGARLTYADLRRQSAELRGGFAAMGVTAGDRIGLALGNRAEFVVAYLALLGMGAVAVPLNPESPAPELDEHVSRSGVTRIFRFRVDLPVGPATPATDVERDTVAVLCDTAGTSGRSRSAVLTHGNLAAAVADLSE